MKAFGWAVRCMTWLGLHRLARVASLALRPSADLLALLCPKERLAFRSVRLPERIVAARVKTRHRVGLLSGLRDAELVRRHPHEHGPAFVAGTAAKIRVPAGAGCCGALLLHNGDRERGQEMARRTIAAFDSPEFDTVLTNAAGCGAAMREYGEVFKDDPRAPGRRGARCLQGAGCGRVPPRVAWFAA